MTLTNRDVFYRDPTDAKIPNDGVAQVVRPTTPQQWAVLDWELKSFVCEGEYARGLERILNSFLINLNQAQQPAVWVSGFYGSGKSHLVRVLDYLWRDTELPAGKRARDLVTLPDDIRDHLIELSTAGDRLGGLWSAAGTLAAGKSDAVRLAFLSVLFESAALPEQYPLARFVIWAKDNGYLSAIAAAVDAAGKSFDTEVHNLYVSPVIASALLQADPTLGDSVKDVRQLLRDQFPPTARDITDDEMFAVMDDVFRLQSSTAGKLPLTLVVLDEMQQYIGDDNEKALVVQNMVEGCSARFGSQILFVATGQSSLTATTTLQKLTDRFAVPVPLSDKDVESVVRKVILRKQPAQIAPLKASLDAVSGEIDRHLAGTQLAPRAADKHDLVPDYPLLPTRRRFWELALRAIDRAGRTGVLRTQLKIVHEAVCEVASQPIGHVVGGDFIYEQQAAGMLQTGVLLKEIDELIRRLRGGDADDRLKSRICALVFLISQMPERTIGGEGLRATAPYLADLLVEDLANDGAKFRKRVPELLEVLATEGALMKIEDEYQLQTEEGAEWDKDYRSRLAGVRDDASRMSQLRNERLVNAVDAAIAGLKLAQGTSKTPRRIELSWGQDEPSTSEGHVPVWIRDEWAATESAVRKAAAEGGDESPTVFVFLPKTEVDQIKETLASVTAAQDTVDQRPTPQTDEGKAALRAMATRVASGEEALTSLFRDVVAHARVFQGGGTELTTSSLRDAVETAANRSLIRLFPKFPAADNPNWGKVVTRARDGAPDALDAVGHQGDPTAHAVCKEVLSATTAGGTKGADLHKRFDGSPFGWPRDAVNGAILTLLAAGNIRAAQDGKPLDGPKALPPTQIGRVTLYREDEPPSMGQRLAVRGLLQAAEIPYENGREGAKLPALLQHLKDLGVRCGGPPPLPEPPTDHHIDALLELGGNQLFRAVADDHERLAHDLDTWRSTTQQRDARETAWGDLQRLLRHADGLAFATHVASTAAAIRDGRQLLDEPDPVKPLFDELADGLRAELKQRMHQLASEQQAAIQQLEDWDEWSKLDTTGREAILRDTKLSNQPAPEVSTDAALLQALDATPLSAWQDRIGLVPSRRDQARQYAAKQLEPEAVTVTPPPATLKTSDDLNAYLDDLRDQVVPHLEAHKTVII